MPFGDAVGEEQEAVEEESCCSIETVLVIGS